MTFRKQTISQRIVFKNSPFEKFHVLSDASFDLVQYDLLKVYMYLHRVKRWRVPLQQYESLNMSMITIKQLFKV